jgi:hypothetical protein
VLFRLLVVITPFSSIRLLWDAGQAPTNQS